MIIKTSECFELIRIINKMGIKADLIKIIKEVIKVSTKLQATQNKLISIAEKKYKGDNKKAVENNIELAEVYDTLQADLNALGLEGIFLVVEAMPRAESEVKSIIAKLNNITVEEVEGFEADVLIEKIKEIVTNESFQRFFTTMMK